MIRPAVSISLLLCIWIQPELAFPLTDEFRNDRQEHARTDLSGLLKAVKHGALQHFTVQQTVLAPAFTSPPRLPKCPSAHNVSKLVSNSINATYRAMFQQDLEVDTTYVQGLPDVQHCTYSSYIYYTGDAKLKWLLVGAASAGPVQLCEALTEYCQDAFPETSGYELKSSSGDAAPALPPVLDFHCTKRNFTQVLDHFDAEEQRTFSQVHWVCDEAWPEEKTEQEELGTIIVFLGNESPLGTPSQPIVFEHAKRLKALVIEVEHRYYGDSQPFPSALQPDGTLNSTALYKWLTVEQVIEDTAAVVAAVRRELDVPTAVPAIVIGGSYGGMLATYHRVAKPDVFAAAIAASAPLSFMFGTQHWALTSDRYHKFIAASVDANSHSSSCRKAIRRGFELFKPLGKTQEGRKQLAQTFNLCGEAESVLPDAGAAFALEIDQYNWFEGYAQVNNQPSLMGQVALVCDVIIDAVTAGNDELEALASVLTYLASNGSASWCYEFNATYYLTGPGTYSYQGCTQGFPNSAMLPDKGSKHGLAPAFKVHPKELEQECRSIFGPELPRLKVPSIAANVKQLVRGIGGVVFTNGELDGWAGGSYLSHKDVWGPADEQAAGAAGAGREQEHGNNDLQHQQQDGLSTYMGGTEKQPLRPSLRRQQQGTSALTALSSPPREHLVQEQHRRLQQGVAVPAGGASDVAGISEATGSFGAVPVAFVMYEAASHCTDTHNFALNTPEVPPRAWKQQRARAMYYAARYADMYRKRMAAAIVRS